MYPVHGDPLDFQRFTSDGLSRLLGLFASVDVRPMGGYFGSLGLFVELGVQELRGPTLSGANGFFFVARKPDVGPTLVTSG